MDNLRLITIPVSHYCEKARWAMDRLGLKYHEERHIQGFHYIRSYLTSGGPNVPVLIDNNTVIKDSTAILKHLDQYAFIDKKLYPANKDLRTEVEQLEDLFDEQLGVDSRRWMYYQMMPQAWKGIYSMAQGVPVLEKILLPLVFPFLFVLILCHPDTLKKDVKPGLRRARNIIKHTDELLSDGRKYLVGDSFSAADLALACMMSPFIGPPQYGIRLPTIESLPKAMQQTVHEFRNTTTGRYALMLFATERCLPANTETSSSIQTQNGTSS